MPLIERLVDTFLSTGRRLLRRPGVGLPAIIVVALACSGLVIVLALVHGIVLRSLPYPEPDRIVYLSWQHGPAHTTPMALTARQARHWIERSTSFESIGAYADPGTQFVIGGERGARSVPGLRADAGWLDVLGVRPALGRSMRVEEVAHGEAVALISNALWLERFAGSPDAIGRTLAIDGRPHVVVGVLPPGFRFEPAIQVVVPLVFGGAGDGGHNTHVIARLAPGVGLAGAQEEMAAVRHAYLETLRDPATMGQARVRLLPLAEFVVGDAGRLLLPLGIAVTMLALLACFNLANLLLAQALARRGETAVELALGARERDLLLRRLAEICWPIGIGLALGLGMAVALLPVLKTHVPVSLPRMDAVAIDGATVALTLLAGLGMLLICLWLTILGQRMSDLQSMLRAGAVARGGRRLRLQPLLVVGQVALSAALLCACLLAVASLHRLAAVDPGFRPEGVISADLALSDARYTAPEQASRNTVAFLDEAIAQLQGTPGVIAVASTTSLPLRTGLNNFVVVPGSAVGEQGASVEMRVVSPDYFRVLQVPLLAGRAFDAGDRADSAPVVVVNRAFAERFLDGDALGRTLRMDGSELGVVGVAADMREVSLRQAAIPTVFVPHTQLQPALQAAVNRWFGAALMVRAEPGVTVAAAVREAVARADAGVVPLRIQPLAEVLGASLALERFVGWMLGGFAALALVLAAVGIYSLLSHLQLMRSHELAVRLALGAKAGHNASLVLRQGVRLSGLGLALGMFGAAVGMRWMADLLYGSQTEHAMTMAAAFAIVAAVALLASAWPARRAWQIQPMVALRQD